MPLDVSGMKEDLNMYGNEYNYFTTYFSVGCKSKLTAGITPSD